MQSSGASRRERERVSGISFGCLKMNRHTLSRHRPAKARSASSRKMTGRPSIPEPPAIESRSRGVLDTPHARGMTTCCVKLMSTVTARVAANVKRLSIA
jgi:hypothetical protein